MSFVFFLIFFFVSSPPFVDAASTPSYINSSLPNMDFSHQDLAGAKFVNGTFSNSNFSGANLQQADFANATLKNANFTNATLVGANLSNADLSGANLTGTDLSQANLTNATVDGAVIDGTKFNGAALANVDMGKIASKATATVAPIATTVDTTPSTNLPEPPGPVGTIGAPAHMEAQGAANTAALPPEHHSSAFGLFVLILIAVLFIAVVITPWIAIIRCLMNEKLGKVEKSLWAIFAFFVPFVAYVYLIVVETSRKWRIYGITMLVLAILLSLIIIGAFIFGVSSMSHDQFVSVLKQAAKKE